MGDDAAPTATQEAAQEGHNGDEDDVELEEKMRCVCGPAIKPRMWMALLILTIPGPPSFPLPPKNAWQQVPAGL